MPLKTLISLVFQTTLSSSCRSSDCYNLQTYNFHQAELQTYYPRCRVDLLWSTTSRMTWAGRIFPNLEILDPLSGRDPLWEMDPLPGLTVYMLDPVRQSCPITGHGPIAGQSGHEPTTQGHVYPVFQYNYNHTTTTTVVVQYTRPERAQNNRKKKGRNQQLAGAVFLPWRLKCLL